MLQKISPKELQIDELIGQGGYGEVYRGTWCGVQVAIKQLYLKTLSTKIFEDFEQETKIMSQCQFPYIIRLYGVCLEAGHYSMIMEYMPKGSLYKILHDQSEELTWNPLRWTIALNIAQGLSYLHSQKIIHRDLKSLNILLNENYQAKICDFGLSKIKLESNSINTKQTIIGTTRWIAPELFLDQKLSPNYSTDIYSYGMILWEISSRELPFKNATNEFMVGAWIMNGRQEVIPENCPKSYADIIKICWEVPDKRPVVEEIVQLLEIAKFSLNTNPILSTTAVLPENLEEDLTSNKINTKKTCAYGEWAIRMKSLPNEFVVCGFKDGKIRVFDPTTGKCMKQLDGHKGHVWDFAIFKENLLMSSSEDGSIKVWDLLIGKCIKTLLCHSQGITSVAAISDTIFATGSRDTTIKLWDFETGKNIRVLKGHSKDVYGLVKLPGNKLASCSEDSNVIIWDLNFDKPQKILQGHEKLIFALRLLSTGYIASGSDDHTTKIWDVDTGNCIMTLLGHQHFVNGISELPNKNIVTSSEDKTIKIWDHNNGKCLQTIECHDWPVWGMEVFSKGEKISILSGDTKGNVALTSFNISLLSQENLQNEKLTLSIQKIPTPFWSIATDKINTRKLCDYGEWAIRMKSLPNEFVVCGFKDGKIRVFDPTTGKCMKQLDGHKGHVWDFAIFKENLLMSSSEDGSIKVWDLLIGKCIKTLLCHSQGITSVAAISDTIFATGSRDTTIKLWDFETGKNIRVLKGHSKDVYGLVKLPGNKLASCSGDSNVIIWDLNFDKPQKILQGHEKLIFALRLLSTGYIASGSDDHTTKIWDVDTGNCIMTLLGHQHFVNGISELPNKNIVTSSEDKTIKIWDHNNGKCLQTIECHDWPAWGMEVFSKGEKISILSGDTKGNVALTSFNISLLSTPEQEEQKKFEASLDQGKCIIS